MVSQRALYERKRRIKLRNQAYYQIGYNVCVLCGTKKNLNLHHKEIHKDSCIGKEKESGAYTIRRIKEAIEHPERFAILCLPCHNSIEPRNASWRR